jgi:hypothetical protein
LGLGLKKKSLIAEIPPENAFSLSNIPTDLTDKALSRKSLSDLLERVGISKSLSNSFQRFQHTFQPLFLSNSLFLFLLTLCWNCWKLKRRFSSEFVGEKNFSHFSLNLGQKKGWQGNK